MNYYRVDVVEVFYKEARSRYECRCLDTILVKKGLLKARELMTGETIPITKEDFLISNDGYNKEAIIGDTKKQLEKYGTCLVMRARHFNDYHMLTSPRELDSYVENFDSNGFNQYLKRLECIKQRVDEDDKRIKEAKKCQKENYIYIKKKIKEVKNSYNK